MRTCARSHAHGFPFPGSVMGYSMRTPKYRFTQWVRFNCGAFLNAPMACNQSSAPQWDELLGVELGC